MKNKKPFYTQFWFVLTIVMLIIAILSSIPFIINCAYLKGSIDGKPNTAFSASDMILFYGSFLSFIGTVSLGCVAYVQNKKANDISNKLVNITNEANELMKQTHELNEKMRKREFDMEKSCLFVFEELKVQCFDKVGKSQYVNDFKKGFNGNEAYWEHRIPYSHKRINYIFTIINISNYPAINCCITDGEEQIENSKVLHSEDYFGKLDRRYILSNEKARIELNFTMEEISKGIKCYLEFGNSFGTRYYQIIKIYMHNKQVILDASVALNIKEEK